MKEEDKLLKKVGTDNPFTVPEGYFENLTSELMNKLPEQVKSDFQIKEPSRWDRVKPWAYMAAMFAGAALIINVASRNPNPFDNGTTITSETQTEYISDEELDYALTHAMFDDYSLYVYLSDADN